jgi:hypothetical protein
MSNLSADVNGELGIGPDGRRFHLPVKASTTIYKGGLVSIGSTGYLVPTTTSGAGPCVGVAAFGAVGTTDGAVRCMIETDRVYLLTNGTSGDAFADTTALYSDVFAIDDNSVAKVNDGTRVKAGIFMGMEASGLVRVLITPAALQPNGSSGLNIQAGSGTFSSGVLAVSTGITVTATSVVIANRKTEAGTDGDEIRVPSADRTVGAPGTGALTFRAFLSGAAATSDTSTFDYIIVG